MAERQYTDEEKSPILGYLKKLGRPATRENYLALDGWDNPTPTLTAEDEQQLPSSLRKDGSPAAESA